MIFTNKKIFVSIIIIFILTSCWSNDVDIKKTETNVKYDSYIVWSTSLKSRILQWNILSNNLITKTSSIAWKITELNCEQWKVVYPKTLIAKITPDYTNPNIKSLLTSRDSLNLQLQNLNSIKLSTINNLDTQISTLESNIVSSKQQLDLSKQNYELLLKQKGLTNSDLVSQLATLEEQLTNLIKQKTLLEKSKTEELEKLENSLENLKTSSYNIISDTLLYIDELYWITKENEDKNDSFENYLSAKNVNLKNNVKLDFRKLNNVDYKEMWWKDLSDYQAKLNNLVLMASNWVKESVDNIKLTNQQIDWYYKTLLWYSNQLLTIKTNLDTIIKNKSTIDNTYNTQIAWLNTNIDSLAWNIDNLKNNKTDSALLVIDSNITNLKSQITSLENWVITLENNLKSLKENKQITIKQLDNQVLNLTQNIDKLNINLSPQNIYAWITWKISKNFTFLNTNIWPNSPICSILADWDNSFKLQISSAIKLIEWYEYQVYKNNNLIFTGSMLTELPTKDVMTQNYLYEKILDNEYNLTVWDKVSVHIDYPKSNIEDNISNNDIIKVPIEYISPRLNWYFTKIQTSSWTIIEKQVKIWEVNLPNIQIKEWLEYWDILIK